MRTFQTNANNDLFIAPNGNLSIIVDAQGDPQAIAQCCKTAVQAQLGEMLYAADQGVPMMATAFNAYLPAQFEAAARSAIMSVQGVLRVTGFTVQRVGEAFTYSATIQTIYGQGTVNG